jgi:hypothetical protein
MPDVRLARPGGKRIWLWTSALALAAILAWGSAFVLGDRTRAEERPTVPAALELQRAPVLPPEPAPLEALFPIDERDVGRLVLVRGVAEAARRNSIWFRTAEGRRILLRVEPAPDTLEARRPVREALASVHPGRSLETEGYLKKISHAEFRAITDSMGVRLPRPRPGTRFGDLPDSAFLRLQPFFVREYYISLRPDDLLRAMGTRGE